MKFVKEFDAKTNIDLANEINNYAREERVEIVQVSYSYSDKLYFGNKALVVFSKGE